MLNRDLVCLLTNKQTNNILREEVQHPKAGVHREGVGPVGGGRVGQGVGLRQVLQGLVVGGCQGGLEKGIWSSLSFQAKQINFNCLKNCVRCSVNQNGKLSGL